ncbi:MAG: hypothetical protein RI894_566, partial [Bacteroidota bacterium]
MTQMVSASAAGAWQCSTSRQAFGFQPEISIPPTAIKNAAEDLVIKTGTTLTVQGTLNMAKGHKITVEAGATLLVDGGTITNKCGEVWDGITVVGQADKRQTPAYQGRVLLRNNAVVEYAKNLMTLGRYYDWGYDVATGGGIVQAENSTFRNNARDVEFMQYHNKATPAAALEFANVSYFKNCTFETTEAYRPSSASLKPHITAWDVYGVRMEGCVFQNTIPLNAATNAALHRKGMGIYTECATYAVDWYCPNGDCTDPNNNTYGSFQGLERGIESIYLPSLTPVAS